MYDLVDSSGQPFIYIKMGGVRYKMSILITCTTTNPLNSFSVATYIQGDINRCVDINK